MNDERSTVEDYEAIGEESTGALAMVADYLQRSGEQTASILENLYESERKAHAVAKSRLAKAEGQLYLVAKRLESLVYDPPTPDERYYLLGEQP